MIINSLRAENVLKYSLLDLSDIPDQGLIAVIGDNESGKSSIGESICFALFGRTFSLGPEDLDKVLRWGESRCSIKLDFTTPNGQRYQIARFLDELGSHGASISREGEEPMVRGVDEVQARLTDIIGFGYTEFIESFYLAQREITTPHPHSFAVKAMAGVDALEKVVDNCEDEIVRTKQQIDETAGENKGVQAQISELGVEQGYLASLEREREEKESALEEDRQGIARFRSLSDDSAEMTRNLKAQAADWLAVPPEASFNERQAQTSKLDNLLTELRPLCSEEEHSASAYAGLDAFANDARERVNAFEGVRRKARGHRNRLERLLGDAQTESADDEQPTFDERQAELLRQETETVAKRRSARVWTFVFLLLAATAWLVWGLLNLVPDSQPAQTLTGWLSTYADTWETHIRRWLAPAAAVLTLLFVAFLVRARSLTSRRETYRRDQERLIDESGAAQQEVEDLRRIDEMPLPKATTLLLGLKDEELVGRTSVFVDGLGTFFLDAEEHNAYKEIFRQAADSLQEGISGIDTAAAEQVERLHDAVTRHSTRIARLDEMISREAERVRKHEELSAIAGALEDKLKDQRHRVRVRDLAVELSQGSIHYISQRFNHEVRNLSADSLPKFTNGRYEHLQIDENLKVKAFSNEKRDFMDLDEISSGTQRQIMLAVRMALSQKLVNSAIRGPQMLFLDEPFAFFDERRTASSLSVLPQVSGDFTQIWVTSQTFPEESHFDLYVECNAEQTNSPVIKRGPE